MSASGLPAQNTESSNMSASVPPATATSTPSTTQPVPQDSASSSSGDGRGALLAALADALAGALGSVVAVAVFYPIDVAKTRAQASSPSSPSIPCRHPNLDNPGVEYRRDRDVAPSSAAGTAHGGEESRRWFRSRTLDALMSIVRNEGGLTRLYHGIEAKALQALLGSFIYFYAYAFIKGVMRRRAAGGGGATQGKSLRPSLNLLAAAMAGAVNQAITLPLENITTRMQTELQHTPPLVEAAGLAGEDSRDGAGAEGAIGGAEVAPGELPSSEKFDGGFGCHGGDCSVDRGVGNGSAMGSSMQTDADIRGGGGLSDANSCRNGTGATPAEMLLGGGGDSSNGRECTLPPARRRRRRPRQSVAAVTGELYREGGGMGRFWRGFAPSLILTCNPAINYTAFDVLKALWLRRRNAAAVAATGSSIGGGATAAKAGGTAPAGSGRFLNPLEAFLVAAAAKSLATLITYPLIRAKVVLMTSPSSSSMPPSNIDGDRYSLDRRLGTEVGVTPESIGDDGTRREKNRVGGNTDGVVCAAEMVRDGTNDHLLLNGEVDAAAPRLADGAGAARKGGDEGSRSNTRGMAAVLVEIFRREGLGGLYAGCGAQLLHTILKSALLLATKEQIARAAASAVFLGGGRSAVGDSRKQRPAAR